jgi:hypothetical protein
MTAYFALAARFAPGSLLETRFGEAGNIIRPYDRLVVLAVFCSPSMFMRSGRKGSAHVCGPL